MIWDSFSRVGWFHIGYDVHAVQSFFADVERTLRGQLADPSDAVTPQAAQDVLFPYRHNGYEETSVDAAIDQAIEQLRALADEAGAGGQAALVEDIDNAVMQDLPAHELAGPAASAATDSSLPTAEFRTPEAVDQILRSMTQVKEQS